MLFGGRRHLPQKESRQNKAILAKIQGTLNMQNYWHLLKPYMCYFLGVPKITRGAASPRIFTCGVYNQLARPCNMCKHECRFQTTGIPKQNLCMWARTDRLHNYIFYNIAWIFFATLHAIEELIKANKIINSDESSLSKLRERFLQTLRLVCEPT